MLGLNISVASCVGSQRGGFMVLYGLVLILRGMRGYEQLSIGVEQVTPKNQTKTNEEKPRGKSQREKACYYFSFSGSQ